MYALVVLAPSPPLPRIAPRLMFKRESPRPRTPLPLLFSMIASLSVTREFAKTPSWVLFEIVERVAVMEPDRTPTP
jgi:hypothetical protein